jgi:hypothetical protein
LNRPSQEGFIPDSVEDLDSPESLDEPDNPARAGTTFSRNAAGEVVSRTWWRSSFLVAAVARHAEGFDGGTVLSFGPAQLGGGAMALPGMGIVGERSRLTRAARGTVPTRFPREAFLPATGSGVDANGIALSWRFGADPKAGAAARIVIGSRARTPGEIAAGEVRAPLGAAASAAIRAAAWRESTGGGTRRVVGLRLEQSRGSARVGAEFARDAAGTHGDLVVSVRERSLGAAARWRRRAGAARPAGLDLEAGWSVPGAAARLRWRSWSARTSAGAADDGRTELDLRTGRGGPGSARLRLGVSPRNARGAAGERLAIGEIVTAREAGRVLRISGSLRATPSGNGWRYGRALGASLALQRRRRAAIDLRAEAVRLERLASAASGSFEIASGGSVRTRTRSGLRLAARGWVAFGAWRVGAAIDDEEATEMTTARAPRASLWLTWNRAAGTE